MKSTLSPKSKRALACVALLASLNITSVGVKHIQAASTAPVIAQKVAVPSYINPLLDPDAWARLATSSPSSVGFAVANVINGPDYTPLDEWARVIQDVSSSGVRVVGYVDTGYLGTTGQRTRLGSTDPVDWMSQIQRDINAWYRFYGPGLSGIFFDQTQNVCGPNDSNDWASLYQDLTNDVERLHPGSVSVLNPGTAVPQCYQDVGDVIVTFEGSYASYIGAPGVTNPYIPLAWAPVDPTKIWHIVYDVPDATTMTDVIALSRTRSAGNIYITNDTLANPYDTLPPLDYWAAELAAIAPPPPTSPPPSAPVAFDTVEVSGTSIVLDWVGARSKTAVAYDVYRDGVLLDSVPADRVTYTAVDLTPRTTHVFTVVARDALGQVSAPSKALTVKTDQPYGDPRRAPSNLVASETTFTSTRLSWQQPRDRTGSRPPLASVVVLQNGNEVMRLPGWVTSVTVGGLAPDSQYDFSVFTLDASGDRSAQSLVLPVTTVVLPNGAMIGQTSVVETPEQFTYSAEFLVPVAFRRVFIATQNPSNPCWFTGSDPQICADFVLENDRLLQYVGDGQNWEWDVVKDVVASTEGNVYTWSISPADIGSPVTAVAVFNANGYAPNTYCGTGFSCITSGPPLPYE